MDTSLPFDILHIKNYAIITEPCTAIIKSNSNLDFFKPYEEDGYNRWIVNLKAISKDSLDYIRYLYNLKKDITYFDIGYLLMTGAIWENQIWSEIQLPVKGENIIATFDYVKDILRCTNITVIPKIDPELFIPSKELLEDIEFFKNIK